MYNQQLFSVDGDIISLWGTRHLMVYYTPYYLPLYPSNVQKSDYHEFVRENWNDDDIDRVFMLFRSKDFIPILNLIRASVVNKKNLALEDMDPMVTVFDVRRSCNKYDVDLQDYKNCCKEYCKNRIWNKAVQLSYHRLFEPQYAFDLHHRLYDLWS